MNLDKTKRLIMKPDKYQLDAIKSTKNTLLIAGAGAGKTFTIVEKIKYLVNEIGIKQEEILVISFTNKSVNDLKKKIDKYLGLVDARLYDVLMVDEKSFKKARKIILKTKFDEVKVALKEVPFAQVLDL